MVERGKLRLDQLEIRSVKTGRKIKNGAARYRFYSIYTSNTLQKEHLNILETSE